MKKIQRLQNQILNWYEEFGRKDLPWRKLGSRWDMKSPIFFKHINRAYGVYISEIMLQQTQVSRVLKHFYQAFLKKFPSLKSLAQAQENELLKAWQGLGYYTRARNLKLCAKECEEKFGGFLPENQKELLSLKGIGTYTAAAIACFGYEKAVSFFDSNIKRVLCRLFALEKPSLKDLEQKAALLLNKEKAFEHNQALLDLGALICTAKNPKCGLCPLYEDCEGKFQPELYKEKKKNIYENLDLELFLFEFEGKLALIQSKEKLYKNMWNFPFFKTKTQTKGCKYLGEFKHSYTKFKIQAKIYYQKLHTKNQNYEFKSLNQIQALPLSNLSLKALTYFKSFKNSNAF